MQATVHGVTKSQTQLSDFIIRKKQRSVRIWYTCYVIANCCKAIQETWTEETEELEGSGNTWSGFWGRRIWKKEECGLCSVG